MNQIRVDDTGEQHRKQRKLLNPVFSTQHMRHMLPIFYEVVERVRPASRLLLASEDM